MEKIKSFKTTKNIGVAEERRKIQRKINPLNLMEFKKGGWTLDIEEVQ